MKSGETNFMFGTPPPEVATFNLQGTHKYTIAVSNLQKFPDTLLAKMVYYNGNNKEHFISQDGELFRYICMFYNLNVLVGHEDACVSKSVWEAYVDYFGLTELNQRPEKRLKIHAKPEYQEIVDQYKVDSVKERNNLVEIAIEMLTWMLQEDELKCEFLEFAPEDQGGKVPDDILDKLELYPSYREYYLVKQKHLDVACEILDLAFAKIIYPDKPHNNRVWKYPANYLVSNRRMDGRCVRFIVKIKVI
jgi:hypothetical protein